MDMQFDELSKSLAEGVSRREALRKFGVGLAGVLFAGLGLSANARADATSDLVAQHHCKYAGEKCSHGKECCSGLCLYDPYSRIQHYCF